MRDEAVEDLICSRSGGDGFALQHLVAAIAGRHGGPPDDTAEAHRRMRRMAGPEAQAFVAACLGLWPEASLAGIDEAEARALNWRLSGLTLVADWLGSNADWFPAAEPPASAAAYLAETRSRAAHAVQQAEIGRAHV